MSDFNHLRGGGAGGERQQGGGCVLQCNISGRPGIRRPQRRKHIDLRRPRTNARDGGQGTDDLIRALILGVGSTCCEDLGHRMEAARLGGGKAERAQFLLRTGQDDVRRNRTANAAYAAICIQPVVQLADGAPRAIPRRA